MFQAVLKELRSKQLQVENGGELPRSRMALQAHSQGARAANIGVQADRCELWQLEVP